MEYRKDGIVISNQSPYTLAIKPYVSQPKTPFLRFPSRRLIFHDDVDRDNAMMRKHIMNKFFKTNPAIKHIQNIQVRKKFVVVPLANPRAPRVLGSSRAKHVCE
jgi:hypothetical protein